MSDTTRPLPGVMYGLTHSEDGAPIIRESKLLKVSIGLPRGKALNVWTVRLDGAVKWKIVLGYKENERKTFTLDTRAEAEACYAKYLPSAPICPYPRKIPFFTFTRPVLTDDGETFVPDFAAIEAHGPAPTEIDVVFFDDAPFDGSYQMWSTSELKCKGDGINAMRVLTMAAPEIQKDFAGERYFPIVGECFMRGCSFGAEKKCKPGGDLKFQLANNIRVGGTAYFHTTGYRSIGQIFSAIERIRILTRGRLVGLPLKMTLRGYRVTPQGGKTTTQYGVSLELRAEDMEKLRGLLMQNLWESPAAIGPAAKLIEEAPASLGSTISAQAMSDEFYPEADADEGEPEPERPPMAQATDAKTDELATKLRGARGKKETPTSTPAKEEAFSTPAKEDLSPQQAARVTSPGRPAASNSADGDLF